MVLRLFLILILICSFSGAFGVAHGIRHVKNGNSNASALFGIELPNHPSLNAVSSSVDPGCYFATAKGTSGQTLNPTEEDDDDAQEVTPLSSNPRKPAVKLHLKHRSDAQTTGDRKSVLESAARDLIRIQTLHTRITQRKNQNTVSMIKTGNTSQQAQNPAVAPAASPEYRKPPHGGQFMATLESGVSLGSGEYFIDVFVGTPPKHYLLILDTGSDLNWVQCDPCYDCFEQTGPHYNPKGSSSYEEISCRDPRCQLVSSPDPPQPCKYENQTCPYYYWYGDSSNTTGDFALETFTVNLTSSRGGKSEFTRVENVMFGCGHWNRGLFHGAAGLLGLGRGPLSFSTQLQSLYGHSFSYCLVDRNSNTSVSSKLIFGADQALMAHPDLNFTSFVGGNDNPVDTFYYVQIKSILVGGEALKIPDQTWRLTAEGAGGTIVDSGTTLSYFAEPAYGIIRDAFERKVRNYPVVKDVPVLAPCYNVTGVEKPVLPTFGIEFGDGAVWNFPVENYFIKLEPEENLEVVCLAMLGTPHSALSIIGNYQQQNFHILYDTQKSRLGFAPAKCADV